jgi:hypothetical protein
MDNTVAFIGDTENSKVEVVVNFGLLTGREATIAEVDRLARRLLDHVDDVTVVACRRHELTRGHETIVHQVLVMAPVAERVADVLRDRCEAWACECAADRTVEPLAL